jgi:hypothetical protein
VRSRRVSRGANVQVRMSLEPTVRAEERVTHG